MRSLGPLMARAASTHPGAQPKQIGGLPWPLQPASGPSKDEGVPLSTSRWREEELRAFKLQPVGERHLACAKRRLERFSVVLVTDMLHASAPLLEAELGWKDTALLQRKVNRQAGCDAQQMYGNDSAVTAGLHHAYNLDLQVYAHARMLFCRALAKARSKRS